VNASALLATTCNRSLQTMVADDSSSRTPSDNPPSGKPRIDLDHASIAARPDGGVTVCVTVTIHLDDLQAIDLALRAVGTIARARGHGEAGR
jgi:hypothetical protein